MPTEKKIVEKCYIFLHINTYDMDVATEAIYDSSASYREKLILRGLYSIWL